MTFDEFLGWLKENGVRPFVEEEQLRLIVPKGLLTQELREELIRFKPRLLERLKAEASKAAPAPKARPAGLTPASRKKIQRRIEALPASPLRTLLAQQELNFPDSMFFVHEGELNAAGAFRPFGGMLWVTGTLAATGNVVTYGNLDNNHLVVEGDLICENLFVGAGTTLWVLGNLAVRELLFASTPDSGLFVGGALSAKVIFSGNGEGWATVFGGRVETEVMIDYLENGNTGERLSARPKRPGVKSAEVLIDEVLEGGEPDEEAIYGWIVDGKSILRPAPLAPPVPPPAPRAPARPKPRPKPLKRKPIARKKPEVKKPEKKKAARKKPGARRGAACCAPTKKTAKKKPAPKKKKIPAKKTAQRAAKKTAKKAQKKQARRR